MLSSSSWALPSQTEKLGNLGASQPAVGMPGWAEKQDAEPELGQGDAQTLGSSAGSTPT